MIGDIDDSEKDRFFSIIKSKIARYISKGNYSGGSKTLKKKRKRFVSMTCIWYSFSDVNIWRFLLNLRVFVT